MPKGDKRQRVGGGGGQQTRPVMISKALSRLLRHQAQADKIPITAQGWVRIDHAMTWHGLSAKNRFGDRLVQLEEIFQVVESNEKKRFAVKYYKSAIDGKLDEQGQEAVVEGLEKAIDEVHVSEQQAEAVDNSTTAEALGIFETGSDIEPSHFFIRAVQGHSMQAVETEGLLTPITLEDPASIPDTVVHGTFYGAWDSILRDGGLKKMNRNMVHFATGPALREVLPQDSQVSEDQVDAVLDKNKVISGMRRDAQILIYVDIRRALEDARDHGLNMKWYRSENGVILTEGVVVGDQERSSAVIEEDNDSVQDDKQEAQRKADWRNGVSSSPEHLVPLKYWSTAVEMKAGVGVLWRQGEGVVKELPDALRRKGVPHGKGRGPRGGGGKGRGRG